MRVLIEHETVLDIPVEQVGNALISRLATIEGLGEVLYREGEELRSRVGPDAPIAKEVTVRFGQPRITRTGIAVPLTWRATGARSFFPRLTGDLEAERSGTASTVIRLRGSYEPPFGWVGDALDRLLLQRVAKTTISNWLERIGASLTDSPAVIPPSTEARPL